MAWTVRTPEGSLDFPSLADVERAYRIGLIDPNDEIRDDRKTEWRKASAHPLLRSRHARAPRTRKPMAGSVALAVVLAGVALYCLAAGDRISGLIIAFAVAALLMRLSRRAFAPRHTFSAGDRVE